MVRRYEVVGIDARNCRWRHTLRIMLQEWGKLRSNENSMILAIAPDAAIYLILGLKSHKNQG